VVQGHHAAAARHGGDCRALRRVDKVSGAAIPAFDRPARNHCHISHICKKGDPFEDHDRTP
jgi:hypothetical protein